MLRPTELAHMFGKIDLFLLDQLLKGNFASHMRILDAGCGWGHNLKYLCSLGMDVHGIDTDFQAISHVQSFAKSHYPDVYMDRFRHEAIEDTSFSEAFFQAIYCIAVLHFSHHHRHFKHLIDHLWRVLALEGIMFVRLWINQEVPLGWADKGAGVFVNLSDQVVYLPTLQEVLTIQDQLEARAYEPYVVVKYNGEPCILNWYLQKKG